MKKIQNILVLISTFVAMTGCELDNYQAPQGCIYGKILDAETGSPIPLPVEGNNGAVISLMETGSEATLAQSFYAKHDGSYRNALVFNGEYTVTASGPFIMSSSYPVSVKGETCCDMIAIPYSRINMEIEKDGLKAKISYTITPTDPSYKVKKSYVLWNYRKQTDVNQGNFAGVKSDFSGKATGSHTYNFENETQYKNNADKIEANGNKVYVRVAAECGGYVNYSEIIELSL